MIPVLYILIRNDLGSMCAGKAAAQASHATSVMMRDADNGLTEPQKELFYSWKNQTEYQYGTVVVLGATPKQIQKITLRAQKNGLQSSMVFDPGYPVRDGEYTHSIYLLTSGYILTEKGDSLVSALELW